MYFECLWQHNLKDNSKDNVTIMMFMSWLDVQVPFPLLELTHLNHFIEQVLQPSCHMRHIMHKCTEMLMYLHVNNFAASPFIPFVFFFWVKHYDMLHYFFCVLTLCFHCLMLIVCGNFGLEQTFNTTKCCCDMSLPHNL